MFVNQVLFRYENVDGVFFNFLKARMLFIKF